MFQYYLQIHIETRKSNHNNLNKLISNNLINKNLINKVIIEKCRYNQVIIMMNNQRVRYHRMRDNR
jgi:hypothetical protein